MSSQKAAPVSLKNGALSSLSICDLQVFFQPELSANGGIYYHKKRPAIRTLSIEDGRFTMTGKEDRISGQCLRLVSLMETLRSPAGCPWDKKQTAASLKPYLLEETYELLEAIDSSDVDDIRDELGDLLLQVVFIAQIYAENAQFDIADVAETIADKLIRRHPHVFADADNDDHAQNWEKIKLSERLARGKENNLKKRIPSTLPALKIATKIARKTTSEQPDNLLDKSSSILQLLKQKMNCDVLEDTALEKAFGELLYTLVQSMTLLQLDAEDILRQKTIQVMTSFDGENHPISVKN